MKRPSRKELLYLADQEQHERGMMRPDNYDDFRANMVKEWALREAAAISQYQQAEERCICQDQHRRGYCTEPTCPYRSDQQFPKTEG